MPPRFETGQRLSAEDMNAIVALLLESIIGGTGVIVKRVGPQLVIEATPQDVGKAAEFSIPDVAILPALPSSGGKLVVFDEQVWSGTSTDPDSLWRPGYRFTLQTGEPPAE